MTAPGDLDLPPLALADWRATRDRLHLLARWAGAVRRQRLPPRPRWAHTNLLVSARGLTTGPFPLPGGAGEMVLDLVAETLLVVAADGWELRLPLALAPAAALRERLAAGLAELEADVELPPAPEAGPEVFDTAAATRWLRVVTGLEGVLGALRAEVEMGPSGGTPRGAFSGARLWPHHFDLAMSWFSGRLLPSHDGATGADDAEEQVGMGFSTGEEGEGEAYLYAICHPWPEGVESHPLPVGLWHPAGWRGAILPWREAAAAPNPFAVAARFWRGARGVLADALAARGGAAVQPGPPPSAEPLAKPPAGES